MAKKSVPSDLKMHTIGSACERLGICRSLLKTIIDNGELKVRRLGNTIRIPEAELRRFAMLDPDPVEATEE